MKKWKFVELQAVCTEAKESGILPADFGCGGKGITKKSLFESLIDKKLLTRTGDLMEQISEKLPVYVIVHSTNDWERSSLVPEDFESPAKGLGYSQNVFGTYTSIDKARGDLFSRLTEIMSRKGTRGIKFSVTTPDKIIDNLARQPSYVIGELTGTGVTDRFTIYRTVVDRKKRTSTDLKRRFDLFGLKMKDLDIATASHKSAKVAEIIEALKEGVRRDYKKVPLPSVDVFFNADAEVWYVSVTGVLSGEKALTTSNYIYTFSMGEGDNLLYKGLGVTPAAVETTKYGDVMSTQEVEEDLRNISKNMIRLT